MTYPAGEALVLTQLQSVTGFTAQNVSRMNWKLLNGGYSDHYAIVKPGTISEDGVVNFGWINQTIVQVWQRYKDESTSQINLEGYVDAVKQRFMSYRKLGDTTGKVYDSRVRETREMQEQWKKGGGLAWLTQEVVIEWREQEIISYAE